MQIINNWLNYETPDLVAQAVCDDVLLHAEQAISTHGRFTMVLAGGSSPAKLYQLLSQYKVDWSKWYIFYGDERCLPVDHPDRNSMMAQQAWLNHVDIPANQIFTIAAELDPKTAAMQYQQQITPFLPFDLVLLGMGEDGHTASLFPGQVHKAEEIVHVVTQSPKPPPERITLSARTLSNTQRLLFMITGASKQSAVNQWQAGAALPVSTITPEAGVEIYIDNAALDL